MKSLKHKIMIPIFVLSTLGFILISLIGYMEAKRIILKKVELVACEKVEKLTIKIDSRLEKWTSEVKILSTNPTIKSMNFDEFTKYYNSNIKLFTDYEVAFIADKSGNYKATNYFSGNLIDREYFHKALEGQTVISNPLISKSTGNPIIIVAVPIKDSSENVIGIFGVTIKLSLLTDIINSETLGDTGYAYMISTDGLVMAHKNKALIYKDNMLKNKNKDIADIAKLMIAGKAGVNYYEYEGKKKLIAFRPIVPTGWSIGMSAYNSEIAKSVTTFKYYICIISSITIILIIIALYFFSNTLVKPINKLKSYMEIAANGDLSVHSDICSNDEIGVLSDSFNSLLKENKKLLEETIKYDKLKTEFFSNISHELRTPLNIIFSTTQLVTMYNNSTPSQLNGEKLNHHICTIKQNCYRLLKLVNNLIDLTRLDSGFIELNLENKNIIDMIENITLSTADYVESKSRQLIFDTDVEEKIMAFDEEKLERVMLNLISNAVKFTKPNDTIEVIICDRKDTLLIKVKDSGIGIPSDKQEIIFQRFRQVDPLYNRNQEGSGIGLSIVKSLIELHGGTISVDSIYGKGTEFIIELPARLVDQKEDSAPTHELSKQSNVEKVHIEFSDIYN